MGPRLGQLAAGGLAVYELISLNVTGALIMLFCYWIAGLINGDAPG